MVKTTTQPSGGNKRKTGENDGKKAAKKNVADTKIAAKKKKALLDKGVSYLDKIQDGNELKRKEASLKFLTKFGGVGIYQGGGEVPQKMRDKINERRRASKRGGDPCFDQIDEVGSSIYVYSLPTNLIRGLLQGFKTEGSIQQFKKYSHLLASHNTTSYMFLHWNKGTEGSFGDWRSHDFVKAKPDLETSILSLGNWVTKKILYNTRLSSYQPGLLANTQAQSGQYSTDAQEDKELGDEDKKAAASENTDEDNARPQSRMPDLSDVPQENVDAFQPPHWDFTGWRHVPAKSLPWVLHVPLCQEGMMLHVWPTERDQSTHMEECIEKFKIGPPRYIHVAFGDALLLRADVAHGGCFGSRGNLRFHMVLRSEDCSLGTSDLHLLEWATEKQEYQKAKEILQKLGDPKDVFRAAVKRAGQTVTAYISSLKQLYPCEEGWFHGLLDLLNFE
jgi:hypothetical protein